MPLAGRLSEILLPLDVPAAGQPTGLAEVEERIHRLEQRITCLEAKISGLQKISDEQREMLMLFIQVVDNWSKHVAYGMSIKPCGWVTDREIEGMEKQVKRQ